MAREMKPCTKAWCEDELSKGWSVRRCGLDHDDHAKFSWGRCKSGKRWFWCVIDWGSEFCNHHGWNDTEDGAKRAAVDLIKSIADGKPVFICTRHGYASSVLREVNQKKRKERMAANPSKATGVSDNGTLWAYHSYSGDMNYPDRGWEEHRIVKVTKKYVWLGCEGRECEGQLFKLDREALERDGHVWGGARWRDRNCYHTEASMKAWELEKLQHHAEWLKTRFAPLPEMPEKYTREDVMKAFREGSLIHHPDQGGDAEAFRKLVEMKDTALQVLDELEATRRRAEQSRAEAMGMRS